MTERLPSILMPADPLLMTVIDGINGGAYIVTKVQMMLPATICHSLPTFSGE